MEMVDKTSDGERADATDEDSSGSRRITWRCCRTDRAAAVALKRLEIVAAATVVELGGRTMRPAAAPRPTRMPVSPPRPRF